VFYYIAGKRRFSIHDVYQIAQFGREIDQLSQKVQWYTWWSDCNSWDVYIITSVEISVNLTDVACRTEAWPGRACIHQLGQDCRPKDFLN